MAKCPPSSRLEARGRQRRLRFLPVTYLCLSTCTRPPRIGAPGCPGSEESCRMERAPSSRLSNGASAQGMFSPTCAPMARPIHVLEHPADRLVTASRRCLHPDRGSTRRISPNRGKGREEKKMTKIVAGDAMRFGGRQRENAEYAKQFGNEAPNWPPNAPKR